MYQAGAGSIIGATSIILTDLTDIYGNALSMTDFGDKGYGTLEADSTNEEGFTFTGVVANANGTYTLTGVSTILAVSPYTEASGLVRSHAGGTKVVITDNVAFWNTFPNRKNDETIEGQWTFNIFPITPATPDASTTVKGMSKTSVAPASPTDPIVVGDNDPRVPTQSENDALVGTGTPSSSNKYVTADTLAAVSSKLKFGGTGADGALTISSGTTTIDCANAAYVIKNYSSVSITGSGKLAFSNPNSAGTKVIILVSGNCTLTSSTIPYLDLSGLGADGGSTPTGNGTNSAIDVFDTANHFGAGATHGAVYTAPNLQTRSSNDLYRRYINLSPGSGGGGGAAGTGTGGQASTGTGGRGGGALYMEVAGTLNLTGTGGVSVAGNAGASGGGIKAGGGGGGAGGMGLILYGTAGTITGNINDAGGNGGSGGGSNGNGGSGTGGGGGGHAGGIGGAGATELNNLSGGGGGGGANMSSAGTSNASTQSSSGQAGATSTGGLILQNLWF